MGHVLAKGVSGKTKWSEWGILPNRFCVAFSGSLANQESLMFLSRSRNENGWLYPNLSFYLDL